MGRTTWGGQGREAEPQSDTRAKGPTKDAQDRGNVRDADTENGRGPKNALRQGTFKGFKLALLPHFDLVIRLYNLLLGQCGVLLHPRLLLLALRLSRISSRGAKLSLFIIFFQLMFLCTLVFR